MSSTPTSLQGVDGVGRTAMSAKELKRAGVLARVQAGSLSLADAAVLLGVC